jgi:glycosyltransferase involved in cell wall biosynthesis
VKPRLLALSGLAPWPLRGGFSVRTAHLLEHLAKDWTITLLVACRLDRGAVPLDESGGHTVIEAPVPGRWTPVPGLRTDFGPLARALDDALRATKPRAALLFNGTEFLALDHDAFPPAVVDRVDSGALERLRYLRRGKPLRWPKTAWEFLREIRYERRIVRGLEATIVAGEDDRRMLRRLSGRSTLHVISNGVEAAPLPDFAAESPRPTVAFTGTLSYHANIDAAVYFARCLWPSIRDRVGDARLIIAGRDPARRVVALGEIAGVEVRENVEDMSAVLREAWIAVAPMRCGTGVKNKVLEAWAVGRPAVMTPIATNGLRLDADTSTLVAGTRADFCDRIVRLLADPEARHRCGRACHTLVRTRHSWTQSADAVSRLLGTVSRS